MLYVHLCVDRLQQFASSNVAEVQLGIGPLKEHNVCSALYALDGKGSPTPCVTSCGHLGSYHRAACMLSQGLDVKTWRHHVAVTQVVKLWREDLGKINPKAAEALADPAQYSNLFPNLDLALQAEKFQVCGLTLSSATFSST